MSQQELTTNQKREAYLKVPEKDGALIERLDQYGFVLHQNGEERADGLTWETQEIDFQIFDEIADSIISSLDIDDEAFAEFAAAELFRHLEQSPLFARLAKVSQAERSKAHSKRNPLQHTFDVVRLLDTSGFTEEERFWLRFNTILHDTGKTIIAKDDTFQWHAKISGLILRGYLNTRNVRSDKAEKWSHVIGHHHILQMVDDKVLTDAEIQEIIQDESQLKQLGALALADGRSVEGYEGFALKNAEILIRILTTAKEFGEGTRDFLTTFVPAVINFCDELAKNIKNIDVKFQQKFKEIIKDFDTQIKELIQLLGLDQSLLSQRFKN